MTNTMTKIISIVDLNDRLVAIGAYECRMHIYGYEDGEISEDPIQQTFGIEEAIKWLTSNPAYSMWGELTGYMIVAFDADGKYIEDIVF